MERAVLLRLVSKYIPVFLARLKFPRTKRWEFFSITVSGLKLVGFLTPVMS